MRISTSSPAHFLILSLCISPFYRAVWDPDEHIEANYEQMGFVADLNAGTGRNRKTDIIAEKAAALQEDEDIKDDDLDDDLRVAMAKQRSTGKAAPKRPTPRQRQLVERLQAAHGDNIIAMAKDRKLNKMQHSKGQLESLIESCEYWAGKTGVDFRVPNKRLW